METNIIIGIVVTAVSFSCVVLLTVVNISSIERIAKDGLKTARETLKDKNNVK
jgi:hypothetical protein